LKHLLTAIISRVALFVLGLFWVPVVTITKKGKASSESWNPRAGDIIVSNWGSWLDVLWLGFRYDPIFLIPVSEAIPPQPLASSAPLSSTPGRRTGTGSAAVSMPNRTLSSKVPITGFRAVSLFTALRLSGKVPPYVANGPPGATLDLIRKKANKPLVVFPECTTSNGRGLLRFANVFQGEKIPTKAYQVFVMCIRYDPPTTMKPTLTHSIAGDTLNPLSHAFSLCTALSSQTMSVRLLAPSESPSSQLFMVNEVITGVTGEDQLSEACASLIAQIGKMKRTGMGWEDKAALLELYQTKRK